MALAAAALRKFQDVSSQLLTRGEVGERKDLPLHRHLTPALNLPRLYALRLHYRSSRFWFVLPRSPLVLPHELLGHAVCLQGRLPSLCPLQLSLRRSPIFALFLLPP